MPRDEWRKLDKGVKGTAKGSPAVGIPLKVAGVGDRVIQAARKHLGRRTVNRIGDTARRAYRGARRLRDRAVRKVRGR
jgi:hypothetical protein